MIEIRPVTKEDAQLLFEWANDRLVRENAINKEAILWEGHLKWLDKKLTSEDSLLFILHKNEDGIGQIRFDKIDHAYEIGYSVCEKYRGKGFGHIILQLGMKKVVESLSEDIVFNAKVLSHNIGSLRVFEKAEFIKVEDEIINEEHYTCFRKQVLFETYH